MSDPMSPGGGASAPRTPGAGAPSNAIARIPAAIGSDRMDLMKSLFLALTLTAFFYEIFPLPFLDAGRVLSVFDNWVSEVIFGLTVWSLFLLMFKYLGFRKQLRVREAFDKRRLRALLERDTFARDADALAAEMDAELKALKLKGFEQSTMYVRVMRVLTAVKTLPKKEGVNDLLEAQAQIDIKRLETGAATIQFFIWAIPIWGFIGTVLGIADSVQQFSNFIQTAETGAQFTNQMRAALGGVTGGLAVAFNTTFLALVLVMPVMLISTMLGKAQEELLLSIEEFCLERLLPRLHIQPGEDFGAESFEDHLHRIQQLSNTWLGRLEPVIGQFTRQAEMVSHQMSGIQPVVKEFTERLMPGSPTPAAPARDPDEDVPRS